VPLYYRTNGGSCCTPANQHGVFVNAFLKLVVAGLFLWVASTATAQTAADDSSSGSTFFGIGGGLGAGTLGIAALGDLFVRFDSHIVALRAAVTSEIFRGDLHDYGILYGHSLAIAPDARVNLLAGVGIMGGSRGGSIFHAATPIASRFAIPLEVQFVYTPLSFLGLTVCGFGDINVDELFGGITLGLQLGTLR
jgi:hypothetical protein